MGFLSKTAISAPTKSRRIVKQSSSAAQALIEQITRARETYYTPEDVEDPLVITDAEYDRLVEELEVIYEKTPTRVVGDFLDVVGVEQEVSAFPKVQHIVPMLSLDKEHDVDALKAWTQCEDIIATPKYDGLSLSLHYENGKLVKAVTRGNGKEGSDVTPNARMILDIPQTIAFTNKAEVRGEVLMTKKRFAQLLELALKSGEEAPKNARNMANGSLRQQNPQITKDRQLSFRAYQVLFHGDPPQGYGDDEVWDFKWLRTQHFKVPHLIYGNTVTQYALDFWTKKREQYVFDIDGIVFRFSNREKQRALGEGRKYPRYAKAFKWPAEQKVSELVDVEWSTGKTGRIVPTGIVKPVELSGATVQRVTLHNAEIVVKNGIRIGTKIHIQRSGEVIPKFLGVAKPANHAKSVLPTKCPSCGEPVEDRGVDIVCINAACPAQAMSRIVHFVQTVKMDGIGEGLVTKMFEAGLVHTAADLYRIQPEDLATLPNMGDRSVQLAHKAIQSRKALKAEVLYAAMGLKGISTGTAEKLAVAFNTPQELLAAPMEAIMELDGFAYTSALEVYRSLQAAKSLLEDLLTNVVLITAEQKVSDALDGKTFVITGTLSISRDEMKDLIKSHGGQVQGSVSSKTQFLVAGEGIGATKLKKAQDKNVTIIDEVHLRELIGS